MDWAARAEEGHQLAERRHDPPSRPVDGDITARQLLRNTDPERVYCLANPNDPDCGVSAMREQGWVIEVARKDGPRLSGAITATDGSELAFKDQKLMSRPRALHEAYEREKLGVADRRSLAIGQPGGLDAIRGPTGRLPVFTEDPREERVR